MISAEFLLFGTIDFKLPPASSAHIKCIVRILCVMCVVRIMCAMCFVSNMSFACILNMHPCAFCAACVSCESVRALDFPISGLHFIGACPDLLCNCVHLYVSECSPVHLRAYVLHVQHVILCLMCIRCIMTSCIKCITSLHLQNACNSASHIYACKHRMLLCIACFFASQDSLRGTLRVFAAQAVAASR